MYNNIITLFAICCFFGISCNEEKEQSRELDFTINGESIPSIVSGLPTEKDTYLFYRTDQKDVNLFKANINDSDLKWAINNATVGSGPEFQKNFTESGFYAISLSQEISKQLVTKYIFVRVADTIPMISPRIIVKSESSKSQERLDCITLDFHATEREGVLYDLPKGEFIIKIVEFGQLNSYKVISNGNEEVTWRWKKSHYPRPSDFSISIYKNSKIICLVKQSN